MALMPGRTWRDRAAGPVRRRPDAARPAAALVFGKRQAARAAGTGTIMRRSARRAADAREGCRYRPQVAAALQRLADALDGIEAGGARWWSRCGRPGAWTGLSPRNRAVTRARGREDSHCEP